MQANLLNKTGIRSVNFYVACPVETCDRCSAGIKNVALVTYKDGESQRYGSECINKILAHAPDLRKLFIRNTKLLKRYNDALEIFSRSPEQMPRGSEYFGSGQYFVADSTGQDIKGGRSGHYFFHPIFDEEKNEVGGKYVVSQYTDAAGYRAKNLTEIAKDVPWFQGEVARIQGFLARVFAKASQAEQLALELETRNGGAL